MNKYSIRGGIALAAVAVMGLSACGGDSSADAESGSAEETVKVAVFPSFNALGARAAEVEGTFDEQGLDVEFVTVATPAEGTPQLLGGKIDFALMDVTTPVIARSEGVPLVMTAPGAVGTEINDEGFGIGNFWVAKDSDIESIEDIEGKTFGVPQTKSQIWVDIRTAVDEAGADSSKVNFVEVPNTISALESGNVDVVTTAEPSGTAELENPDIEHLSGYVVGGEGEVGYAYITSEEVAQSKPEVVEKFTTAVVEANQKLNSEEGLPAEVAATYIDAPTELLEKARYAKFGEEAVDEDVVEDAIDRVLRYNLIDDSEAPDPSELVPNE